MATAKKSIPEQEQITPEIRIAWIRLLARAVSDRSFRELLQTDLGKVLADYDIRTKKPEELVKQLTPSLAEALRLADMLGDQPQSGGAPGSTGYGAADVAAQCTAPAAGPSTFGGQTSMSGTGNSGTSGTGTMGMAAGAAFATRGTMGSLGSFGGCVGSVGTYFCLARSGGTEPQGAAFCGSPSTSGNESMFTTNAVATVSGARGCWGCAGTIGSAGTFGGCAGTVGTGGCFGCGAQAQAPGGGPCSSSATASGTTGSVSCGTGAPGVGCMASAGPSSGTFGTSGSAGTAPNPATVNSCVWCVGPSCGPCVGQFCLETTGGAAQGPAGTAQGPSGGSFGTMASARCRCTPPCVCAPCIMTFQAAQAGSGQSTSAGTSSATAMAPASACAMGSAGTYDGRWGSVGTFGTAGSLGSVGGTAGSAATVGTWGTAMQAFAGTAATAGTMSGTASSATMIGPGPSGGGVTGTTACFCDPCAFTSASSATSQMFCWGGQ